jgi:hypothetical protein
MGCYVALPTQLLGDMRKLPLLVAPRGRAHGDLHEPDLVAGLPAGIERRRGPKQQDVVGVHHRRVGRSPVLRPHRAVIELAQGAGTACHVGEATQPHEPVGAVEVAELPEDPHTALRLGLEQMVVEEVDELITPARTELVLAQFDDPEGRHQQDDVRLRSRAILNHDPAGPARWSRRLAATLRRNSTSAAARSGRRSRARQHNRYIRVLMAVMGTPR